MKKGNKGGAMKCAPIDYHKLDEYSRKAISSDKRFERYFGLMIATGIRTGLRFSDLSRLSVDKLQKVDGIYRLIGTSIKTKQDYNRIIPDWLALELIRSKKPSSGLLIHNNGEVYSATWFNRRIKSEFPTEYKNALKEGKTIGAHSLRKASALHLLAQDGSSLNTVVNWLQHRSQAITQKYLELNQQEMDLLAYAAFS